MQLTCCVLSLLLKFCQLLTQRLQLVLCLHILMLGPAIIYRYLGFNRKFWLNLFNIFDLPVVLFCQVEWKKMDVPRILV